MYGAEIEETLRELARESGRSLAEVGVRASDAKWIREHAETIASLAGKRPSFSWRRLWRRARGGEERNPSLRSG
jgi:hypothetical protein